MAQSNQNNTQKEEHFFMKYLVEELNDETLPNKGDVLRYYLFLVESMENKMKKNFTVHEFQKEIAKEVAEKVLKIWSGLGIQTTTVLSCRENVQKLHTDYIEMKKSYEKQMSTERQLDVLNAWAEQCDLLFFAEKRGARNECEPEIKKLLMDATKKLHQFRRKDIPYERLSLRPKAKAKGPEAGPSREVATDANNNSPWSPSENPPGEAELAKSSTARHAKKSEAKKARETGPSSSSGDADAMRCYEEFMRELAEYDERNAKLEARKEMLTQGEKNVEVDAKSSREAARKENKIKTPTLEKHLTAKANPVVASSVSTKKHAEKRPKHTKNPANTETPAHQGDSLDCRKQVAAIDPQSSTPTTHHEKVPSISRTDTPKLLACDATETPTGTTAGTEEFIDAGDENLGNTILPAKPSGSPSSPGCDNDGRAAKWRRYDEELKNARQVLESVSEEVEVLNEQTWALLAQIEKFQPEVSAMTKHAEKRPREEKQEDSLDCPKPAAKSPRLDLLDTREDFNGSRSSIKAADVDDERTVVKRDTTSKPRDNVVSPMDLGASEDLVRTAVARGKVQDVKSHVRECTALHVAVQLNMLETAKVILDRQPDSLYIGDSRGTTPLHLAGKLELTEMIDSLLEYDQFHHDLEDDHGMTHFMCACMSSRPSEVEKFFLAAIKTQQGMSVERFKKSCVKEGPLAGCTPLALARRFGCQETVDFLNKCFN